MRSGILAQAGMPALKATAVLYLPRFAGGAHAGPASSPWKRCSPRLPRSACWQCSCRSWVRRVAIAHAMAAAFMYGTLAWLAHRGLARLQSSSGS